MVIFFIFVRGYKPVFSDAAHRCLSRQSIEAEGMEDGKEACLLTGIQVLRIESHQAR